MNLLKIKYPVIQAPMAGNIVTPQMVSTICNSGLLGFIPGGYLNLQLLEEFIVKTKQLLVNPHVPLGVNVFLENVRNTPSTVIKPIAIIELEQLLQLDTANTCLIPATISEHKYIDLIIKHNIPIVSCTFGFFAKESVNELKNRGITIIGNATTLVECTFCLEHGADAVVIQGTEAGGHQASFLSDTCNTDTTIELLKLARKSYPQATIIATGGISPQNMFNYFDYGANYVQLGTAFMMTDASSIPKECKQYMIANRDTILTKAITGKYARGICNQLSAVLQPDNAYNFPIQHYLTAPLRAEARKLLNPEYMSLWAGVNVDNFRIITLDNLIKAIKIQF